MVLLLLLLLFDFHSINDMLQCPKFLANNTYYTKQNCSRRHFDLLLLFFRENKTSFHVNCLFAR